MKINVRVILTDPMGGETAHSPVQRVSRFVTPARRSWATIARLRSGAALALVCLAASVHGATWYVDSGATGSNNGTSWANAWTSINSISGIAAGDTVYISGGPTGGSRSYSTSGNFPVVSGSSGSARTSYLIGQDSSHNGTAMITLGSGQLLTQPLNNFNIVGDAGDGKMHFVFSGLLVISWDGNYIQNNLNNVRLGYINFGNAVQNPIQCYGPSGFEFDHNYIFKANYANCQVAFFTAEGMPSSAYGLNQFHNNVIYAPRANSGSTSSGGGAGYGDDFIQAAGGSDIYSNSFIGYYCSYAAGDQQHEDGVQVTSGSYVRVFNNWFVNSANSCVFPEPYFGPVSHWRIFNNICTCDSSSMAGSPMRGIDINSGLGSATGYNYSDVVCANNIIVDLNGAQGAAEGIRMDDVIFTFTSCVCANNIIINAGGYDINSSVLSENNTGPYTSSQVAAQFVAYSAYAATNNNFHLASGATLFKGLGANLTSYGITIDMDGNTRAANGAWDIGPYQYGTAAQATNPIIQVSPGSLTFSSVAMSTIVTQYITVQNVGGGTLSGIASVGSNTNGFKIVSGGAYTLGSNQSQLVGVAYSPTGATLDNDAVNFTGGGGATAAVSGQALAVLPGLSFLSYAGTITAPFVTNSGGYVSQSVETSVTNGGSAVYAFIITNGGNYTVAANVNAPNDSANSFYVNIDSTPVDPTMIWDIPVTVGFTNEVVSWRGNGSDSADEYVPAIFSLSAGAHQLIIIGREAGAQLGEISIAPYSAGRPSPPPPPLNLRVVASGP